MCSRSWISAVLITFASSLTVPAFGADDVYKPEQTCDRLFSYKGSVRSVDTGRGYNGEGLRAVIKSNPNAEEILNTYQSNRKTKIWFAAAGTLGAATILGGIIASPRLGTTRVEQKNMRYAFTGTGVLIILGGYAWSQWQMKRNEHLLNDAVDQYNRAAPEDKRVRLGIELDPTKGSGQVTTEVRL